MPHFNRDQFHAVRHQGGRKAIQGCLHFIPDRDPQALDQEVTKQSPTLGRDAIYSKHSRLERLPTYLTVHMVRFTWKPEVLKKAKIMVRGLQLMGIHDLDFS